MNLHLHIEPLADLTETSLLAALVTAGLDAGHLQERLASSPWGMASLTFRRQAQGSPQRDTRCSVVLDTSAGESGGRLPTLPEGLEPLGLHPTIAGWFRKAWDALAAASGSGSGADPAASILLAATAVALDLLGIASITCSPLPLPDTAGSNSEVDPVALELMHSLPVSGRAADTVRVTPSAVALVRSAAEFRPAPTMMLEASGAAGEEGATRLRVLLGRPVTDGAMREELVLLEANLDDLPAEILGTLIELCLERGALDAWLAPVLMKKGRPGHVLSALCDEASVPRLEEGVFRETSSLGVRITRVQRDRLERSWEKVTTPFGAVRVKVGYWQGEAVNRAPEFEDCRRLAREKNVPVKEVYAAALAALGVS